MRAIGIDPGTGSFDFFGMDSGNIILDTSIPVPDVAQNPNVLLDTARSVLPLDMIIGPSGYGLPLTSIRDMTERKLTQMVPDDKSIPLYDGIRMVLKLMKEEGFPVYFTPGVIHLQTVPAYRKANKMDMGTADKVCCIALAIRDQSELYRIDPSETSFILVEVGYAFNAIMGVKDGKVVDGIGGTSGGPGFITLGSMDSELAMRLGRFPGVLLFSGGAKAISGKDDLTPSEMAKEQKNYSAAWNMLLESVLKGVAAMMITVEKPREIILSGRLTDISEIAEALTVRLSQFSKVRKVRRKAKVAKEAAEGAYVIGEGLLGGKYKGITDSLELSRASGTMYDYIQVKGAELEKP
jgi:predicted butyrate kinase (DUF1464 family)